MNFIWNFQCFFSWPERDYLAWVEPTTTRVFHQIVVLDNLGFPFLIVSNFLKFFLAVQWKANNSFIVVFWNSNWVLLTSLKNCVILFIFYHKHLCLICLVPLSVLSYCFSTASIRPFEFCYKHVVVLLSIIPSAEALGILCVAGVCERERQSIVSYS